MTYHSRFPKYKRHLQLSPSQWAAHLPVPTNELLVSINGLSLGLTLFNAS